MKKDIHPSNYREVVFKDMSCEEIFITRSTVAAKETIEVDGKEYPLVKLEITSASHPFFTGKQKLVPLSYWAEWVCQCFSFSAPVGCAVKWFAQHGKTLPAQKGLLTAEIGCRKVKGGTISCLSSIPLLNVKSIVECFTTSPKEVLFPEPGVDMDMHYMKLRFALPSKKISYLGTIFITTLESMFFYMEENWEMLCDDIEKGIINPKVRITPEAYNEYSRKFKQLLTDFFNNKR